MSNDNGSERLAWVVETLAVQPQDRLLEIGCGHGVAMTLVCEKLDGGHIVAIDRSQKMIDLAEKRNRASVAAGKASLQTVALHEAEFGAARFDKVFAVRIGVFFRGAPARELAIIHKALTPGGSLYLFYDPFTAHQIKAVTARQSALLSSHGFSITNVLTKELAQTTVIGIIARK